MKITTDYTEGARASRLQGPDAEGRWLVYRNSFYGLVLVGSFKTYELANKVARKIVS